MFFICHCLFNEGNVKLLFDEGRLRSPFCQWVGVYLWAFLWSVPWVVASDSQCLLPGAVFNEGSLLCLLVVPPSPEVLALVVNIPKGRRHPVPPCLD